MTPTAQTPQRLVLHADTRAALTEAGIDPDELSCSTNISWPPDLERYAKEAAQALARQFDLNLDDKQQHRAMRTVLGYMVRSAFDITRNENFGMMALRGQSYTGPDGKPRPLLIFRTGVTADPSAPNSCVRSLIRKGLVRHVINLYSGKFPLFDLIGKEREVARALGATHHDRADREGFRHSIDTPQAYEKNKRAAMAEVADLIKTQILRPGGKPARGNVHFHCGGGMHRTGMVFAVLRRCINNDPWPVIEAEYKRHTAYRSPTQVGGFEALNLRFVREFDCALLK